MVELLLMPNAPLSHSQTGFEAFSNHFNTGAFTWPMGVVVNYVTSFVLVYRLGEN